jgi:hypothetical protein
MQIYTVNFNHVIETVILKGQHVLFKIREVASPELQHLGQQLHLD